MLITPTDTVSGRDYDVLDTVIGKGWTIEEARADMIKQASHADAIVGLRITTEVGRNWTRYILYGAVIMFR